MEGKKKRRIYTIIGICVAVSSLFFFLQIGTSEQLNVAQASLYRLFGILAIVLGSVFVLFGLLKGHHESHEQ
ncbi:MULTISPECIES: hypothetical protein [unclassified Dysgonomonas]|uniref:hypothetical protein n=1 Tax=unclassified Dysgonomonas TaxID=2630389 RepID=UPI00067FE91B|nr:MULTISPECIES: hypothetical protein [unclassified Dysgonomonas]MBD8347062.1 hypothetical protein [Dysgonomonas sp. HGC4]MBF0574813.1 hypothetical protein [Dysgonomonas sp. GY617]